MTRLAQLSEAVEAHRPNIAQYLDPWGRKKPEKCRNITKARAGGAGPLPQPNDRVFVFIVFVWAHYQPRLQEYAKSAEHLRCPFSRMLADLYRWGRGLILAAFLFLVQNGAATTT